MVQGHLAGRQQRWYQSSALRSGELQSGHGVGSPLGRRGTDTSRPITSGWMNRCAITWTTVGRPCLHPDRKGSVLIDNYCPNTAGLRVFCAVSDSVRWVMDWAFFFLGWLVGWLAELIDFSGEWLASLVSWSVGVVLVGWLRWLCGWLVGWWLDMLTILVG